MKTILRITALAAITVTMQGCASFFTIGKSETQCGAYEAMKGTKCMSMRELYKESESEGLKGGDYSSNPYNVEDGVKAPANEAARKKSSDGLPPEEFNQKKAFVGAPVIIGDGYGTEPTPYMQKPLPIRSQPKVQRIWIAPYEDLDGDLLAPGIVYTEIESRKWNVGEEMVGRPAGFNPVQTFDASPKTREPSQGPSQNGNSVNGQDMSFLNQQMPVQQQNNGDFGQ